MVRHFVEKGKRAGSGGRWGFLKNGRRERAHLAKMQKKKRGEYSRQQIESDVAGGR